MKNYAKYIDPDTSKIYFMSLVDDSAFSVDSEGKLKEENIDKLPKYIQEALLMSDKMIVLPDDLSGLTKEELSELMNETPAPETPAPETPAPETPAPETPAPETPAPASEMKELPYELQIEYSAQNIKDKLISDLNGNRMYMETEGLPLFTDKEGKRKLSKNGKINNNRKMVNVDVGGFNVPFYLSTGKGGKKNVPSGKWFPYWGTKDGWLNKTNEEDINSYYDSPLLKTIGESLDAAIGDIRNELIPEEYYNKGQWSYESEEAKRIINRNMIVPPASYFDDTDAVLETINKNIESYKKHEASLIEKAKESNTETVPEPTVPEPTVPEPTVPEPTVPEPTVPKSNKKDNSYIKYTVTGTPDEQLIGFTRADLAESDRFVSAYTRGAKGAVSTGEPIFITPKRVDPESGQLSFDVITRGINERNVQSALGKVTAKESAKLKQLNEELVEGEITLPDTLLEVSPAMPVSPVTGKMTLRGNALKQAQQIVKEQKLAGDFTPTSEEDVYAYSFFGMEKPEINKLFAPARATSKKVLSQQKAKEEEAKTKAQVKEIAEQKKAEDKAEIDAEKLIAQAEEQAQKQEEREQKEAERHEQAWLDFQVSQVKQEKAFAPEAEKLIEQAEAQELVETEAQVKEVARQKKEKEDLDAQNEKLIAQAEEQARKEEERKQKEDEKERKDSLRHLKAGMMRVIAVLGIISDVTRRILSASLSSAKETFEKQREARTVGVSLMDRRNMDIMDIAKGMEKGTTFGAISDIQTMFGDITNLDDKALERLARVMGSEVGELVRSGIGGEAPDKLLNKILNKYFEQFRQGKNSLGQYVGQEASARELTTQLRQVSPEIANIFATMVTDSLAGVFKGETVEDWQKMFDPNQSGLLQTAKEYNSEIARRYNEILAVVADLKDNFFTNLGNELDGMLRSVSVWLNKLKPDDKKLESDIANRQKDLESKKLLESTYSAILSEPTLKKFVEGQTEYSVQDVINYLTGDKTTSDKHFEKHVRDLFTSGNMEALTLLAQAVNIQGGYLPELEKQLDVTVGTGKVKDVSVSTKQMETEALQLAMNLAKEVVSGVLNTPTKDRYLSDIDVVKESLRDYFNLNPEKYDEALKLVKSGKRALTSFEKKLPWNRKKTEKNAGTEYVPAFEESFRKRKEAEQLKKGDESLTAEEEKAIEVETVLDVFSFLVDRKKVKDIIDWKAVENIQKAKIQKDIETLDESYPKLDTSADVSYIPSIGELESKLPVEESLGKSYTEGNKSGTLNVHLKLEKDNQTKEVALFTGVDSGLQDVKQTVFVDSGLNAMTIAEAYV